MAEMTDRELIGYCRLHCTTERALFHARHINRMLELAGHPEGFVKRVDGWLSVHDEMQVLCDLAEKRLAPSVVPSQPPSAGLVDCGECRTQGCRAGKCRNAGVKTVDGGQA